MHFHVITLFPEMIEAAAKAGVIGQALAKGKLSLSVMSPRQFTSNVHHTVDDRPFGGGDGMIMLAETLAQSVEHVRSSIRASSGDSAEASSKLRTIHVSPRGTPLTDAKARELSKYENLILISSRYGGADQRFLNSCVDEEISIGDYILTGGELAALVLIDSIGRLQGGVLGNDASSENESFAGVDGLLENPQFTRPRDWQGQAVPKMLLSGDHAKIKKFQMDLMVLVTAERRPDLLEKALPNMDAKRIQSALKTLESLEQEDELALCGIKDVVGVRQRIEAAAQSKPVTKPKGRP